MVSRIIITALYQPTPSYHNYLSVFHHIRKNPFGHLNLGRIVSITLCTKTIFKT